MQYVPSPEVYRSIQRILQETKSWPSSRRSTRITCNMLLFVSIQQTMPHTIHSIYPLLFRLPRPILKPLSLSYLIELL